jgi:2-keto-4-pentenoate hydratase/2-oxohepta-3-ene-1,7-dioic acid hydratase in catechol pathway
VHAPSDVVRHASRATTLYPGDVIALGTPYPFPIVDHGDDVEIEVEGIGVLTNHVVRRGPDQGA